MADWCLRIFVILQLAQESSASSNSAWHLVTALFIAPFVVLAPLNGALSNGLPKQGVLIGSAALCLVVLSIFCFLGQGWLVCVGLVALGSAIYSPARYALLPAAAADTHWPLSRITGWIEMGGAGAIVAGMAVSVKMHDVSWHGLPAALAVAVGLSLVAVAAAWPVWFAGDVRRPEPPGQALAGFFRDTLRVWQDREARGSMLGLAALLAILTAGSGAVVAYILGPDFTAHVKDLLPALVWIGLGTVAGSFLASLQWHPFRCLGLVPFAATGLLVVLAWATTQADLGWHCVFLGVMGGVANVPLRSAYQGAVPADARGNGMAVLNTAIFGAITTLELVMLALTRVEILATPHAQLWFLAALAGLGAVAAWVFLLRNSAEQFAEILVWPLYRVRAYGPGLLTFPRRGPVVVLANHTSWCDPMWMGKVVPRPIIAMMTSVFYDLPVMNWLMRYVNHSIRVEASRFRREAPELQEAIAALDRGECLMVFPEGRMRRKQETPLRLFGQGIWHILHQRPQTPVVVCWIEGGWGSYASYRGGPPTVNKRFDFWRPIAVAFSEPRILDAEILADQRMTRSYLVRACLDARRILGLEPEASAISATNLGTEDEGDADAPEDSQPSGKVDKPS